MGPDLFFRCSSKHLMQSWVITVLCCLATGVGYAESMRYKQMEIQKVKLCLAQLGQEKQTAFKTMEELELSVSSQEDPAWIEMVLMRDLGMVPDGWLKVHFQK